MSGAFGGFWGTSIGVVLVLFILLVIITVAWV
ncbi:sporulation protein YjcZ [Paenibacillus cisolokensis]